MADITLITGSTLGNTEYVAEHLAEKLNEAGYTTEILHGAELEELTLEGIWLVATSTHGAGELPDNIQPLYEQLQQEDLDLSQIRYGAIGLGSSEYDTFCNGINIMDEVLTAKGATRIGDLLQIDVTQHDIPEDPAEIWLANWIPLL
ncbi:MAG: FMN-binding protein MioC [Enterobacteriaceae bacterium]